LGSQSVHAGWFALSWGIGVAYDLSSKDREINRAPTPDDLSPKYLLPKSGQLQNGFVFLTQFAIGAAF
jgi:hypothetical protein